MKNKKFSSVWIFIIGLCITINIHAQLGCPTGPLHYTSQSQVDSFLIKYPSCQNLIWKVTLSGPEITSLNGLQNLKKIFLGGLHLDHCTSLQTFAGLDSVDLLTDLIITGDIAMDTLRAWPALKVLDLWIKDNNTIKSLKGLHTVRQNREIFLENTVVKNLNGLAGDSILFDLNLKSNKELEDVDAMVNKKQISRIFIENNVKLKQIDGIGYIKQALDFHLKDNHELTYLPDFNELKSVTNILIREEPAKTKTTNIPRFKGLKNVNDITIFGLHKAGNYNGFDSLEVAGKLYFQILGSTLFEGFNRLIKAGSVVFTDGKIETINAFQNLEELNGFTVTSCGSIRNINGFGKVKKLNNLSFSYNHINFEKLECFTSLEEITGDLRMENNQKTHSVYFPKLKKIGGELYMQNNRRLTSIEGLITLEEVGSIKLHHLDNLKSLVGLDNINHEKLKYVNLFYNDSLNFCSVKSICQYLDGRTTWHQSDNIEGNTEGCRTVEEILANCETTSVTEDSKKGIWLSQDNNGQLRVYDTEGRIESIRIYTLEGKEVNIPQDKDERLILLQTDILYPGMYIISYTKKDGIHGAVKWVKI